MSKKKAKRDVRISARITKDLYKQIEEVAQKRRWSVSDCVEEGLYQVVQLKD